MRFDKVALVGVGLLGGSLGMALRGRRMAAHVAGLVRRDASIRECLERGAVDSASTSMSEVVSDADVVVLCTPVGDMPAMARAIASCLAPRAVITDVGSVKGSVMREVAPLLPQGRFVGSHPMAGSEQAGVGAARADLFDGARCAVTPFAESLPGVTDAVEGLWRGVGAEVVWIPVAIVALLIGGVPFRYLSLMSILCVGVVPVINLVALPLVSERGPERIKLYLDMLEDKPVDIAGAAYAPYYVSMAVGKAGWSGIGWNAPSERGSLHAKRYIPWKTAHNDFIFSVLAEEQGFRGSLLLLTAFALLLIQSLFISFYSRDMTGRLVVTCVVAFFFAHIFENIGMCVLIMPITGIPLPLISYSGTFVVMCMFMLGLVQSVWIHRNAMEIVKLPRNT